MKMIDAFMRKAMTDEDREKLRQAAKLVQEALGEDSPESLDNTPQRFAALIEATLGPANLYSPEEEMKAFPIPDGSNMLITLQGHAWSVCEHHLQPCELHARIGYIPQTIVPGYSKPTAPSSTSGCATYGVTRWCDRSSRRGASSKLCRATTACSRARWFATTRFSPAPRGAAASANRWSAWRFTCSRTTAGENETFNPHVRHAADRHGEDA